MKKPIYFLLFLILLSNTAYAIDAPGNLTATPLEESAILEWDAVPGAVNYKICLALPNIRHLRGLTPPIADGILDTDVANYSQTGVIRPPNPINPLDHDEIFAVVDNTTLYMGANTTDNDLDPNDDSISVYFDFNDDGLTTDDVGYRLEETGINKRFKWSGSAWIAYGGSGATFAVGGTGTTNVVYELFVPLAELPVDFLGGNTTLVVQRECEEVVDIYTYFPDSSASSITDPTGWQQMFVSNFTSIDPTLCFNVTNTSYNLQNLDSYSAYEVSVSAFDGAVYSSDSEIEFITKDYPLYNVSGYVLNSETLEGINGVLVVALDTYTTGFSYTNESGYYVITGLHNDLYNITASKNGYTTDYFNIVISDADVIADDLLLERVVEPTMVNVTNVPISIYALIVFFGLITGAYAILRRDNEYYTHMIACIISSLLFGASSYISFAGVTGEGWSDGTAMPIMTLYTLPSLGYLFAGIAAILVFYFLMRMYDIYQENADAGWMKQ